MAYKIGSVSNLFAPTISTISFVQLRIQLVRTSAYCFSFGYHLNIFINKKDHIKSYIQALFPYTNIDSSRLPSWLFNRLEICCPLDNGVMTSNKHIDMFTIKLNNRDILVIFSFFGFPSLLFLTVYLSTLRFLDYYR